MAPAVRSALLVGLCLLACSESGPEQGGTATDSTSSAGGATAAGPTSGPSSGAMDGSETSSLASAGGSNFGSMSTDSSAGLTGSTGPGGGVASGGSGGAGGDAGASPTASSDTSGTGEGGSSGSSAGNGGSGAGGTGGTSEPGALTSFTLAVIGSSTAAGEGASSSSRGWVSLLASELEDRVVGDFVSRNLAVGGYATSQLMPGSESSGNIDDAIDEAPNLILVALAGSNDLSNGVSSGTFLSRLATIRDTAVEAGIPIFFVSTAPKDLGDDERETLFDWAHQMRDEFDPCWTPNTASYSPCAIDIFEALANSSLGIADEYGSGDGIHLNDAGHQRIFEIAESVVAPYVCAMTTCTKTGLSLDRPLPPTGIRSRRSRSSP